jgi:hypothetical protein
MYEVDLVMQNVAHIFSMWIFFVSAFFTLRAPTQPTNRSHYKAFVAAYLR